MEIKTGVSYRLYFEVQIKINYLNKLNHFKLFNKVVHIAKVDFIWFHITPKQINSNGKNRIDFSLTTGLFYS